MSTLISGFRVTPGSEASNNFKSYLLNGMSHLYGLVEAKEGMLGDQERYFVDNCSQDEVLTSININTSHFTSLHFRLKNNKTPFFRTRTGLF